MKFYIYTYIRDNVNGKEKQFEVVPEPSIENFAAQIFDASRMEFTGIMVEAETPQEAWMAYNNPTREDTMYSMVEEPQATLIKRRIVDTKKKILNEFTSAQLNSDINTKGQDIVNLLQEINNKMIDLSKTLAQEYPTIFTTEAYAYEVLREGIILNIANLWRHKEI